VILRTVLAHSLAIALILAIGPLGFERAARADEGMWTYNNFPKHLLEQRYGFSPSDAWLEHLRLSSVRFNNGGSGAFVSPEGLVITNHHVGSDCIQELSSSAHDYMAEGFYAPARACASPPCRSCERGAVNLSYSGPAGGCREHPKLLGSH